MLHVVIDKDTQLRLEQIAREKGMTPEELGGYAVDEAALNEFRGRNDDPVKRK